MATMRAFIAIDLPADIRQQLEAFQARLRTTLKELPIRWTPVNNMHLTLKFLGEIHESNIPAIANSLKSLTTRERVFEVTMGTLGAFPNMSRARAIWIGIGASDALLGLQNRIDIELAKLGYPSEGRKYQPHLTLGRITRIASTQDKKKISKILQPINTNKFDIFKVDQVHIVQSNLQPKGVTYSKLYSANFANK